MTEAFARLLDDRLALLPCAPAGGELLTRDVPLSAPGRRSANRSCGLVRTADGWLAINLARPDDRDLIPALTGRSGDPWRSLKRSLAGRATDEALQAALELQLPASALGEADPAVLVQGSQPRTDARVLDLSALWAGPQCAALLARAGATVRRIENPARPDPTPQSAPLLDQRLNGGKQRLQIDLSTAGGRAALAQEVEQADVVVTSARAGALARLGLDDALMAQRAGLVWIAITAHGWAANRVGFGDDCAVAGGLVGRHQGEPRFLGDAIADPLAGLEAALAALSALGEKRGGRFDIAMARIAAAYTGRTQ